MKKSSGKISFGDFSASEYAFSKKGAREVINRANNWTDDTVVIKRPDFLRYFGHPNELKNGRHSWSGKAVPSYNEWNYNGQILSITPNNDVEIRYSFEKDTRHNKESFPEYMKSDSSVLIAIWLCSKLEKHVNSKFNNKGFFICKKDADGVYQSICFGKPFDYTLFIQGIKDRKIIFDSGMYNGNNRNYSQFRASAGFWDELSEPMT